MKLFIASDSNLTVSGSSNAHSNGLVILANDLEEATKLIPEDATATLEEIPLEESKVVLYADGDC